MEIISAETVKKSKLNEKKNLRNSIIIYLCIYGEYIPLEGVQQWFRLTRCFMPSHITQIVNSKSKKIRYDEALFDNIINSIIVSQEYGYYILRSDKSIFYSKFLYEKNCSCFEARIPLQILEEQPEFLHEYEEIFVKLNACMGYMVNSFDDYIIQNPQDANTYSDYDVDELDYVFIKDVPVIPSEMPGIWQDRFDVEFLPGHHELYDRLLFTTAPYMWFGPDYLTFVPFKKLQKFRNCEENTEFAPGFRRVFLWNNVREYNAKKYRLRQWAFRRGMQIDPIVHKLKNEPFRNKEGDVAGDPSIEFKTGEFEHGGELLAIFYFDKKGQPTVKSKASACIYREMKGNSIVWQEKRRIL